MLEKLPLTYRKYRKLLKFQDVDGGRIAYLDRGDGPVILLVHGVPTSSWLYRHVSDALVQKGFRVVVPDLLGYGASDKPKGYEVYHEERQGLRLLQLMDALHIESWIHTCHDVGGLWTWEMLQQDASKTAGLVILNTIIYEAGFQPPMRFDEGWAARVYTFLYKWWLTNGLMINLTLKNGLADDRQALKFRDRFDREGYKIPMLQGGNRALYYFFTQTCNALPTDYKELLQTLDKPATVIWGAKDPMLKWLPQAEAVMADLRLSDANVHILEHNSHFIQEEEPEQIAELINRFASPICSD